MFGTPRRRAKRNIAGDRVAAAGNDEIDLWRVARVDPVAEPQSQPKRRRAARNQRAHQPHAIGDETADRALLDGQRPDALHRREHAVREIEMARIIVGEQKDFERIHRGSFSILLGDPPGPPNVGSLVFRKSARQNPAIAVTLPSDPANSSGAQRLITNYFVCVGAQKASTTWLTAVLSQHPDIFTTPVKEIHYFDHVRGISPHLSDRKRRQRFRKYLQRLAFDWPRFGDYRSQWGWYRAYMQSPIDDAWYEGLFSHRGGARLAGEATPEYAILGEEGFRHIKRLAPDAKAIFVMRNPLDRHGRSFSISSRRRTRAGPARETTRRDAFWDSEYSVLMRDYPKTIDALIAVFGADRVKFLFFEDVHTDRGAAIRSLCAFLGVAFEPGYFSKLDDRKNVSPPLAIPSELRAKLIEQTRDIAEGVRDRLGDIPQSWRDDFAIPARVSD